MISPPTSPNSNGCSSRENSYLFLDTLIRLVAAEAMPYKQLFAS
jgi:hypothetical protein